MTPSIPIIKVAQRDSVNSGYDWTAVYDGVGRRLKTTQQIVTAGVASGSPLTISSIFDPQVEFLEIGVAVNGAKAWKVYGPDLNGRYGGLNGTGGLEATIVDSSKATKGVINDQFGNGVASVTGGAVTWFATKCGGYGPLPGSAAEALTNISRVAEATAWRGRRIDPTGFYNLGARYYEPTSGRFLSADPLGHGASRSLYDYCNGDPVNQFDPDGRSAEDGNTDWRVTVVVNATKTGAIVGGIFGGVTGGTAGGILGLPTGPGALLTGSAGAAAGAIEGTVVGAGAGAVAGATTVLVVDGINTLIVYMAGDGTPRTNGPQNKQFNDAVRQAERESGTKLTTDQIQRLHREVSKQNYSFSEIVAAAKEYLPIVGVGAASAALTQDAESAPAPQNKKCP